MGMKTASHEDYKCFVSSLRSENAGKKRANAILTRVRAYVCNEARARMQCVTHFSRDYTIFLEKESHCNEN